MSQQIEENSVKQLTLHWLYGLDEYFTHINHPQLEKYLAIKNALIHENIWKMQELAIGEVYRGPTENTEEFFHIIFSRLTGYENVTHRKVLNYISHCVDDDFLRRISYWSSICEKKANFNDHFSRGQIKSKIWLIEELNKISPEYLGNLTLETINTKEATEAMNAYTASLEAQARAKVLQEKLQEAVSKQLEAESATLIESTENMSALEMATAGLTQDTEVLNQKKQEFIATHIGIGPQGSPEGESKV